MSEVNADGVLLNPHEALLQEVQALTNSLTAEEPEGMEELRGNRPAAGYAPCAVDESLLNELVTRIIGRLSV